MKSTNHQNTVGLGALLFASFTGIAASATLSTVSSSPTTDLLLAQGNGAGLGNGSSQATFGYRNADASGTEGTRGRGQSFVINSTVGATYDISSLTLALASSAGNGTRPEGDLTLTVFEYTGSGATAADQVDDTTDWNTNSGGASGTEVYSGTFDIAANSTFASSDFLTIAFSAGELLLEDDTAYGFFFQYALDDVTGLSADVTIAFDADNNAPGDPAGYLLNTNVADTAGGIGLNGGSTSRDLNYFITGTVVPEPSSALLLGLGSLGLLARRRK